MNEFFLRVVNASVTATWIALALIVVRALLRKRLPKWLFCAAWGLVAARLVLPVRLESYFSLVPNTDKIIGRASASVPAVAIVHGAAPAAKSVDVVGILSKVWLAGVALMLIWFIFSYVSVMIRVRVSVRTEDGAFLCDGIPSPFLLGVVRPKIYIPSSTDNSDVKYIIAHENAHRRRGDHLWKPLGYFLLSANWFNPVMWIVYVLLCRDIEYACDEKVVSELGNDIKRSYSEALMKCSVSRKTLAACPVAFAEAGVKQRIRNVLNYKRPTVWIIAAAAVLIAVLSACFFTNRKEPEEPASTAGAALSQKETETEDACASGHDYALFSEVAPTCAAQGVKTYKCSVCGDVREDVSERLPHEYSSALISDADCVSGAVTEFTCALCGDVYRETGEPSPDAHDYSVWETLTYPGCITAGVDKISCSRCGASYTVETAALGHNFAGATCSSPETCILCGETRGEALGHTHFGPCEYCGQTILATVDDSALYAQLEAVNQEIREIVAQSGKATSYGNSQRYGFDGNDHSAYYDSAGRNVFEWDTRP